MILSSYSSQSKAEEESLPRNQRRFLRLWVVLVVFAALLPAATAHRKRRPVRNAASKPAVRTVAFAPASTSKPAAAKAAASKAAPAKPAVKRSGPWRVPNFADSTEGDVSTGEDMVARQAAIDALGKLNGSVVVADAASGRILSLVNQKLALKSGFQPCSTIKVPVALAALSEIGR